VEPDDELREIAEAVQVIARTALDELSESRLIPSAAQWARAQALPQAREWIVQAIALTGPIADTQIAELQLMIEGVTKRWAELILTGDTEVFEREEMLRRERGQD
jgi:TPP-dependent trihydroxycyclohexane-1,2-dione (THcHDO) dehydratase